MKFLQRDKREIIPLDFKDYRKHFSITSVPADLIKDMQNNPIVAKVNRQQAIDFLKQLYDFKTREEMTEELNAIASDVCRTVQRES